MKLIMEAWRSAVLEVSVRDTPGGDIDVSNMLSDLEDWYNDLDTIARFFVDFIDPTGLTDWPDARVAFNEYLDWYLLPDGDPKKDPIEGAFMFANAVVMLILAVPLVDLVGAIGFKAVKGFGKLKDALPRKDAPQEIIIWMFDTILKIINALGYAILSYGTLVLQHLGGTYKITKEQRLKVVDMAKKAEMISDKREEAIELNRERTRAAARYGRKQKEKEKKEKEEKADKKKTSDVPKLMGTDKFSPLM